MFKSIDEFRRFSNRLIVECLLIVYTVLTIAYIVEYINGTITIKYTLVFCLLLWGTYLFDMSVMLSKRLSVYLSNIIVLGYLVFYSFCMFTTASSQTWAYVFPFAVLVPLLFKRICLVIFTYTAFLVINIIELFIHHEFYFNTSTNIIETKQRFSCIILVLVFLLALSNLLRRYEEVVTYMYKEASIDQITGLKSGDYITEKVVPMINDNKNIVYTMVLINIDRFFKFNDKYGHEFGDRVLIKVSEIINEELNSIKSNVVACRIYGDKFILIFTNRTYDEVSDYYRTIKNRLNTLILKKDNDELFISTTISVTDTRLCEHTYEGLYRRIRFLQDVARSKSSNSLIEDSVDL